MPLLNVDQLYRLGVVERVLSAIFPEDTPSRPTLIKMCEEGILDGKQLGRGRHWHVYKSSLDSYIRATQPDSQQKLAA